MKDHLRNGGAKAALGFSIIYVAVVCSVLAFRMRSYWLDEAFIFESLTSKSIGQILWDGPLLHGQLFPKFYFSLIKLITTVFAPNEFWPRFLPFVFGLMGFAVWFLVFYEFFALRQESRIAFLAAMGLLLGNAWGVYYAFELKQYSAEFFFAGLLFFLYQTRFLSEKKRLFALGCSGLTAPLFCYPVVFVLAALLVCTLIQSDGRLLLKRNKNILAGFGMGLTLVLFAVYRVDYVHVLGGGGGDLMHSYWAGSMVQGAGLLERLESLSDLYQAFLTDWWKTEYGPMRESFVDPGSWFILGKSLMGNVDARNFFFYLSLIVIFREVWSFIKPRPGTGRSVLGAGAVLVAIMAVASYFHRFPWGLSRLSFYAMPVSILLIVEGLRWVVSLLQRSRWTRPLGSLVWTPPVWLVFRNSLYAALMISTAPFSEDVRRAVEHIPSGQGSTVVVSSGNKVIVDACRRVPASLRVVDERVVNEELKSDSGWSTREFYYPWAHTPPDLNEEGVPISFQNTHTAQSVFLRKPELALGLIRLRPASQKKSL